MFACSILTCPRQIIKLSGSGARERVSGQLSLKKSNSECKKEKRVKPVS
jgi:hypothetical protein